MLFVFVLFSLLLPSGDRSDTAFILYIYIYFGRFYVSFSQRFDGNFAAMIFIN